MSEDTKELNKEIEYLVEQDGHFFTVKERDLKRFPNSFLALLINAEKNGFKKSEGTVQVKDRNTGFFEYVEQVYRKGYVKIKDESITKLDVRKELEFWFTDIKIPISYKDIITARNEYFAEHFAMRKDFYTETLETRASMGFLSALLCPKEEISFPELKNQSAKCFAVYTRFLSSLYPKDEFSLSINSYGFTANWKLNVGTLGKATERALDDRCKRLWKKLFLESEKNSFSGCCKIRASDDSPEDQEFFGTMTKDFRDHFDSYVKTKSKYKINIAWIKDSGKSKLKLTWGFQVETILT